jgi:predicted pyridoxine 5'-phosphate oxidase superfamily flavin-nucleotide-binding protein
MTMATAPRFSSDVAFSPSVKTVQSRKGSRRSYSRVEERGAWQTTITPDVAGFIARQTSVFLATANAEGQPYVQHRGGPPGFLHVLDDMTIGFVDFTGNRQYITQGKLTDNPKAQLFLIDYTQRQRIKIWGEARIVEDDSELIDKLMPEDYKARPEQVILFTVTAWDANCPQHIPQRFDAADLVAALAERDKRIADLEAEIARLRADTVAETTDVEPGRPHTARSRDERSRASRGSSKERSPAGRHEESDDCIVPRKPRTKPSDIGGGDGGGKAAGRGKGTLRRMSRTQSRHWHVTAVTCPRIGAAWVPNTPKADHV